MKDYKGQLWSNYFESQYKDGNEFTEISYKQTAKVYHYNYGNFLPANKDAKILDIGCGTGHFLYYLFQQGYKNFWGIDISEDQIKFIIEGAKLKPNLFGEISKHVKLADTFEFLQYYHEWDTIVANDVLEHIEKEKILDLLNLIYRALNRDGIFIAKVPNLGNPLNVYWIYHDFTHEIGFTDVSLSQILKVAGFKEVIIAPFISPKNLVLQKITNLARRFILNYVFGVKTSPFLQPLIFSIGVKR